MELIPIAAAPRRACGEISQLLRRDRRLRQAMGMPLSMAPRTATQARDWAVRWCARHGAAFFLMEEAGQVVGGLTVHADRVHWYVGSRFTPDRQPRVGKEVVNRQDAKAPR